MSATITFFPVGNGDMTLIQFASGRTLLIDLNIRDAESSDEEIPDVLSALKKQLSKDDNGRYSVDALLVTHPDQDHCRGLRDHFYLGAAKDYPAKSGKVFIKELWSSPMIFRRASKEHALCDDAAAYNAEARRRVKYFRDGGKAVDGERIQVLGEDLDGKTDDLTAILVTTGGTVTKLNGASDGTFNAVFLGPLPPSDDDEEEEVLAKNHSSTILNFTIYSDSQHAGMCKFLASGDAEVAIWEKLWDAHKEKSSLLEYNVLLTPHHCSWHSLSFDSWSEDGESAELNESAHAALGQALAGAILIASSKPIADDDDDPPCIWAKREYAAIAEDVGGEFICLMDAPKGEIPVPFEILVDGNGPKKRSKKSRPITPVSFSQGGSNPPPVDKRGGGRYA